MSAIRQMLISTIALAVIPPVCLRGAEVAAYVGGTAKSIPVNATGSLNVDNSTELRFNYGQSVYRVPFASITSTEILNQQNETRHLLKLRVPSFGKKKETLAINYKDAAGAAQTANFELSAKQAKFTREAIETWKTLPQMADATEQNGEWWGDKYWKTNRNKNAWTAPATAATPAPAAAPAPVATGGSKEN